MTKHPRSDIINLASSERRTTGYGGIAQLGERLNGIQEVSGSIPLISTKRPEIVRFQAFCFFIKWGASSPYRGERSAGYIFQRRALHEREPLEPCQGQRGPRCVPARANRPARTGPELLGLSFPLGLHSLFHLPFANLLFCGMKRASPMAGRREYPSFQIFYVNPLPIVSFQAESIFVMLCGLLC